MNPRNPLNDPDVDGNTFAWMADQEEHEEDCECSDCRQKKIEEAEYLTEE